MLVTDVNVQGLNCQVLRLRGSVSCRKAGTLEYVSSVFFPQEGKKKSSAADAVTNIIRYL